MEIFLATNSELEEVAQYTGQALTEGSLSNYSIDKTKANSMMEKVLNSNGKLVVGKDSKFLVGWVLYGSQKDSITDEENGFIYEIYVMEDLGGLGQRGK